MEKINTDYKNDKLEKCRLNFSRCAKNDLTPLKYQEHKLRRLTGTRTGPVDFQAKLNSACLQPRPTVWMSREFLSSNYLQIE